MKLLLLFIPIFAMTSLSSAQDYTFKKSISKNIETGFTTDYLGNIYLFQGGDLTKYDKDGNQLGIYSIRDFGAISYVDATNPLKTLVVYGTFSQALILDAQLSANATIDLNPPGMVPVFLICTSRDEGFWIYDENVKKLKKVDIHLQVIGEGTDLSTVISDEFMPDKLVESGKLLFLHDPGLGILVFDRYGTYLKTLSLNLDSDFQADGDNIIYQEANHVIELNVNTFITNKFELPPGNPSMKVRIAPNRIFQDTGNEISIYSF